MIPASAEGRLLLAAIVLLLLLIGLSAVGERTLPLFAGDRDLASRVYKTLYVAIGGGMLSLAAPALVTGFAARLRAAVEHAQADGALAQVILSDRMLGQAHLTGYGLAAVFAVAGIVGAALVWFGAMWPDGR